MVLYGDIEDKRDNSPSHIQEEEKLHSPNHKSSTDDECHIIGSGRDRRTGGETYIHSSYSHRKTLGWSDIKHSGSN